MEDSIRKIYEMLPKAISFMTANSADFTDVPFVAPTVAALQAETDTLSGLGAAKLSTTAAARDSTIARGDARDELGEELAYIGEVWRSIPDEIAGMENKFRVPRGNNDQTLIAAGNSFADEAADPNAAAILTKHGMPPPFFTELRAKAAAFEQSINHSDTAHGERVGTNAAFSEPARRGKKLVDKLSPAVKRRYRDNPQKLAEWLVASHVERPAKPPADKKNAEQDVDKTKTDADK